jgi:stage III sporulation protein AG
MVLVGSGKEETAVLVCYENPEISGIGVVIDCAEDAKLENRVISLISAAFSLKTNKIYVAFSG